VTVPAIVAYGREHVGDYRESDYRAAIRRAFVEQRADFLILDSDPNGQMFRAACVAWGIDNGFLVLARQHTISRVNEEFQTYEFKLTEKGRTEL
jgi:hypothetical protein